MVDEKSNIRASTDSKDSEIHLQEINEEIYKRNLELAVVNKTLSLLRKLYQISLLTLDTISLSEKITEAIRGDLNMELVGVFLFRAKEDALMPLSFSKSERLTAITNRLSFPNVDIINVFKNRVLKKVIYDESFVIAENLQDLWGDTIKEYKLNEIIEQSHIKTILLYPLIAQSKAIGILLMGINHEFSALSHYEKDSIESLDDVVAVALDKALLYEQLEQANNQLKILDQARSEFITIASHQLRTPPATIKWYLASILDGDFGKLPTEAATQLRKTQWTNDSLISLIDDLLNVSRIERGKMEFLFEPIDILAITQLTVDQLAPQAENKKLKLVFERPIKPLPMITADKEKLRQVINNFIDNAIKYTKTGQVTVDLSATETDVILRVTDTGRGVKAEMIQSIFDKFDRGKEAVRNSTGLGLGLYVAKVIIDQHMGKIWVESSGEGKGSSFIFSIPIKNNLEKSEFDLTKDQKISN